MATQEPINTHDFMVSFKGFMDKAVAQVPDEEPVFLRSLRTHFGTEPKDLPTVKSEPYLFYVGKHHKISSSLAQWKEIW